MAKRLFDLACAALGVIGLSPVIAVAAIAVMIASPGPPWYRARRVGRHGRIFTMYKIRTMHAQPAGGWPHHRITATRDPRVFPLGRFLRSTKIDELPQLINVLRGEMSIVGPRPEDPAFVSEHYAAAHRKTLAVRPGLASPGSLFQYTAGDQYLTDGSPETSYLERLLPLKLALDAQYVRRASLRYDLRIVARTLGIIAAKLLGRRSFPDPPELLAARRAMVRTRRPGVRPHGLVVLSHAMLLSVALGCTEPTSDVTHLQEPGDTIPARLVGAGDIASCARDTDEATAALLDHLPGIIFTTGDNVYPDGTAEEFAECYGTSWGRHRERTRPSPGNHDYHTSGASGYFAYFGDAAGPATAGYYSYDVGEWHVIALNSEIAMDSKSPQVEWLRDDLAAHPTRCTLAYWHRPRFSSGTTHGSSDELRAVWSVLYAAGVDLVLGGHEHHYERFAPQTPDGAPDPDFGMRQIVVGTGGASGTSYDFGPPLPTSEIRRTGVHGVLDLELNPDDYAWRFVPVPGDTFVESGTGRCHDAPGPVAGLISQGRSPTRPWTPQRPGSS